MNAKTCNTAATPHQDSLNLDGVDLQYQQPGTGVSLHFSRLVELDQQTVMDFMRRFYSVHGITPPVSVVRKQLRMLGPAGYWNPHYLKQLFPPNGLASASGVAGLPKAPCDGCV